jgi:hypothetical protein
VAYSKGLDEATTDALTTLIAANMSELNGALTLDDLWDGVTAVTSAMVLKGDPENVPPLSVAPLWVCVLSADDALLAEQTFTLQGNVYKNELAALIRVYFHPDLFDGIASPKAYCAKLETALSRVCDFFRKDVFNTHDNLTLTLASDEYGTGADVLDQCHLARIRKDWAAKGHGDTVYCRMAEMTFTGYIE